MNIEDKLAVNKYDIDKEIHIQLREDICKRCEEFPCLYVCPAGCFKLSDDHITFSYEGCLECGSCRIVCPEDNIEWDYPVWGKGIIYKHG